METHSNVFQIFNFYTFGIYTKHLYTLTLTLANTYTPQLTLTYSHIHTHIYMRVYVCNYTRCMCMHVCIYICMCACNHERLLLVQLVFCDIYVCRDIYVCVCVYIYISKLSTRQRKYREVLQLGLYLKTFYPCN
jgi:hypothetical protein